MFLRNLVLATAASVALTPLAGPAFADPAPAGTSDPAIQSQPIDTARLEKAAPTGRVLTAKEKDGLQSTVEAQLQKQPGGKQISPTEVSYNNGKVIVVFPLPGEDKVSIDPAYRSNGGVSVLGFARGCPYGDTVFWKCLYDTTNWGGRMVQYQDFGVQNLPTDFYNKAESAVNTGQAIWQATQKLIIYSGTGGTGTGFVTLAGAKESPTFGSTWNNTAKSIAIGN